MKPILSLLFLITFVSFSQNNYSVSNSNPYGLPNPEAPEQVMDFEDLIGKCNCKSVSRNQDQTWADAVDMTWEWKYIMNGMAVQDETIKADGKHSGSIRQFIADSSKWYVHYYASGSPSTILPVWEGNKTKDGNIVLYRDQKAPNGTDGWFRLTFYDINDLGYKWVGEWVDKAEKITYATWKIDCKREKQSDTDLEIINKNIVSFSEAVMAGDHISIANMYTNDGKIFPNNRRILTGVDDLKSYWKLPEGVKILNHKVMPTEIKIENDIAYDYGYYQGKTLSSDKKESEWKGKYVIIWKKINNEWKIFLDIWNSVPE